LAAWFQLRVASRDFLRLRWRRCGSRRPRRYFRTFSSVGRRPTPLTPWPVPHQAISATSCAVAPLGPKPVRRLHEIRSRPTGKAWQAVFLLVVIKQRVSRITFTMAPLEMASFHRRRGISWRTASWSPDRGALRSSPCRFPCAPTRSAASCFARSCSPLWFGSATGNSDHRADLNRRAGQLRGHQRKTQ